MRSQALSSTAIDRIVSARVLIERLGVSEATLYRMLRRGEIPQPLRLSPGRCGWRERDIIAWLDARAAGQQ